MKYLKTRRRRILSAATTLGICAAIASAAWLTEGVGDSGGKLGQLDNLAVVKGSATDNCFPGQTCDGFLRVTNPVGNGPLEAITVEDVGETGNGEGRYRPDDEFPAQPGCGFTELTAALSIPAPVQISVQLPPGQTTDVTAPDLFRLAANASDACQGQAFLKRVRVTAQTVGG